MGFTGFDEPTVALLSRRSALRVALGAAALLLLGGCRSSRSAQELRKAEQDLLRTLDELADSEQEQARLSAIAKHLIDTVNQAVKENAAFLSELNGQSIHPDVPASELRQLIHTSEVRRRALRHEWLRAQDEIRAELTADEWQQAVVVLNRKVGVVTRPPWEA